MKKRLEEEDQAGRGRVCSGNSSWWSPPDLGGKGAFEFMSDPKAIDGTQLSPPSSELSSALQDNNSTYTRLEGSVGHAWCSHRVVRWVGLRHETLKIWFVKTVKQISPSPNPFSAGPLTGLLFLWFFPRAVLNWTPTFSLILSWIFFSATSKSSALIPKSSFLLSLQRASV